MPDVLPVPSPACEPSAAVALTPGWAEASPPPAPGSDAARLLRAFAAASSRPLTMADLRRAGVARAGLALYELELSGHRVTRVYGCDARRRRTLLGYRVD